MLNQLENLTKRVGGSHDLVDRWLQTRKHLLVAYYNLVGIKPGKDSLAALDEVALDTFCQGLVDYLSTVHFKIYENIIRDLEKTHPRAKAIQLYPQLEANTQQIMDLYDTHFESAIDQDNCIVFQNALSEIGEAMASRFAIEDKLIVSVLDEAKSNSANDPKNFARPA